MCLSWNRNIEGSRNGQRLVLTLGWVGGRRHRVRRGFSRHRRERDPALQLGRSGEGQFRQGPFGGVGSGEGDWRLKLTSLLEIEVLAYARTEDGFLTAMHDLMLAIGAWPPTKERRAARD